MGSSDWRPQASQSVRRLRAKVYRQIRLFFEQRDVLEVDTPILSSSASTDPELSHLYCDINDINFYLQTSPEFAMKRLLASGAGSIFQICRCFRGGEIGRHHCSEFVMLEWYRLDFSLQKLIQETSDLLQLWWPGRKVIHYRYRDILKARTGLDYDASDLDDFRQYLGQKPGNISPALLAGERDQLCDMIFAIDITPTLGFDSIAVLTGYPASQAQFAKLNEAGNEALRFEIYFDGIELANAYEELLDSKQQSLRFSEQNKQRESLSRPPVNVDQNLISALEQGLPQCSGIAMGIDRLLMLIAGKSDINEITEFPVS